METGGVVLDVDPWRKYKIIQAIAALDIVVATFSIFYNGKTLLVIFDGLNQDGEERNWPFVILILSITFGIQLLHIVLAMMLFNASKEESSTLARSLCITKIWLIASISFFFLLVVEFYVGLRTFDYNSYIVLFVAFVIFKMVWRIFTILYVFIFRKDLQSGLAHAIHNRSDAAEDQLTSTPVFRLILTSPNNINVDVSDNETDQISNTDVQKEDQGNTENLNTNI